MNGGTLSRIAPRLGVAAALLGATIVATAGLATADGTETLGTPSIPVATGTGSSSGGVGLRTQPGMFSVDVPADADVEQVLVYWEGHHSAADAGADDTVEVNGVPVTGQLIGGPTKFFSVKTAEFWSSTYRADITSLDLVAPGTNSFTAAGMDFDRANNGIGMIVIHDDGGPAAGIDLVDGNDLAYYRFADPLDTTVPQTLGFDPAPTDRTVAITLFASSVEGPTVPGDRPNVILVTVDGVTTSYPDPLGSNQGAEFDVYELDIDVPAGVGEVTIQALSADENLTGNRPASFAWLAAMAVAPGVEPVTASLGDRVWSDTNANGTQDDGEPGVAGVTVTISTAGIDCTADTEVATTTTDDDGNYLFTGLTPGQPYVVTFTLPDGTTFTTRNTGDDATDSDADPTTGTTCEYTLAPGETNLTVDAGIVTSTPPTTAPPTTQPPTTEPPTTEPPTTEPPEPEIRVAAFGPACVGDIPYINYEIEVVGTDETRAAITFSDLDGNVVAEYTDMDFTGQVIYPGASASPPDWPGWVQNSAGNWVPDPTDAGLRDGLVVTVEVNPTATASVTYPDATEACADPENPATPAPSTTTPTRTATPVDVPAILPETGPSGSGSISLMALLALLAGAAMVGVATRRSATH